MKHKRFLYLIAFLSISLSTNFTLAQQTNKPLKLQLRWHHQFQFAGYYAAKHKGFYSEEGLDVDIIAGSPSKQPISEVLNGNADFAEGNSEVVLAYLYQQPLVAMAAIYQRSPSILLTLATSNIYNPKDLSGKTVMLVNGRKTEDADLMAMLNANGQSSERINIIPSSYQINDLITGKTDAFNAYLSNETFYLEEQNIPYQALQPKDYGIDFYSDILFTSQAMLKKDPKTVEGFLRASLKGWEYALSHPEEIIHIIKEAYNSDKSYNHLRFEANTVRELIMPELIPIGHINPERLVAMGRTLQQQGLLSNTITINKKSFDGFIYQAPTLSKTINKFLPYLLIISGLSIIGLVFLCLINKRLKTEINRRKDAEALLLKQSLSDPLTGLNNRRGLEAALKKEAQLCKRDHLNFCIIAIDIDHFKYINDSHGHHIGDNVLIFLANIIRDSLRQTDISARTGGEEFILALHDTELDQALTSIERMRVLIEASSCSPNGIEISITTSFGIAEWRYGEDPNTTIQRADKALYDAKNAGRNCIRH